MKIRKSYICIALILLILCIVTVLVFAHGGRTDANGGHYDRSTGEYHYHHGYPAHQHTNGVCPYDYDDKTNHSNGGSSSNNGYFSNSKSETTTPQETQKESETLSWEEWKWEQFKKRNEEAQKQQTTTETLTSAKETVANDDNSFKKTLRNFTAPIVVVGGYAVVWLYCYIKDKIKKE